jgi:hypothetical protein
MSSFIRRLCIASGCTERVVRHFFQPHRYAYVLPLAKQWAIADALVRMGGER